MSSSLASVIQAASSNAPMPSTLRLCPCSARHAKKVAVSGVNVVIASGSDGGGHVGRIGTMSLIPKIVDCVDVPVLAAGGLADRRGLVAALTLGANCVWFGTRFIATEEARGHANYKSKIVDIDGDSTLVTRAHSGKPNRMIRNRFTDEWASREHEIKPYPLQLNEVGELGFPQRPHRRRRGLWRAARRPRFRHYQGGQARRGGS